MVHRTHAELNQTVTALEQTNAVSPTIGRRLYTQFREVGLVDIDLDPINFVFTDFETLYEVTYIEDRLEKMVDTGMTTPEEADAWVDDLRQADRDRTLFSSVSGYTVGGTVPE